MASLEHKVVNLERQVRQLSTEIDLYIAKDKELLARLRGGRGAWRTFRRAEEMSLPSVGGHPFDEPSCTEASATPQKGPTCTATNAPVLRERSNTDSEDRQDADCSDANSI
jgi:hypothetical protein